MPEQDDMPEHAPDPTDEAYLRAEQALDDEAARAARRARVLAAVAQDAAAPAAPAPAARSPMRRYGGWLAAAGVAGISILTAEQVYRSTPRRDAVPAPAMQPPAPALTKPPAAAASQPAPAPMAPQASTAPPPVLARRATPPAAEAVPLAPRDEAPPPPLALPPVEKPIAPSPPPPPPPPPVAEATQGAAGKVQEDVVVSGSRQQSRAFAAQSALASKPLDGPERLRAAAAAGRTTEIETLLAQGVPVDAADDNGETPLMKSLLSGRRDAAILLRRHGASLDRKSRAGVSARDLATSRDDPELDQALGLGR